MATAVIRTNAVSGTSFSLDVSALELDSNLSIKDFIVTHDGLNVTASYTKVNTSTIAYAGAAVTLGTVVQVTRETTLSLAEVTFLSTTTAQDLTNALTKLRKVTEEAEAWIAMVSAQLAAGGITLGVNPVNNGAYGTAWDNDTLAAPSRNAVYDRINQLLTGSNSFSGSYNFNAATVDVPTAAATDNDTTAANTGFVQSAIDNRTRLIVNRTNISPGITAGSFQDLPLGNEVLDRDNAYNPVTYTWTCPTTGVWRFDMYALPITSGGTPPTKTRAALAVRTGSNDIQIGGCEIDSNFAHAVGTYAMQVTSGTQFKPRIFVDGTGGSGYAFTVGGDPNFLPMMMISRLY